MIDLSEKIFVKKTLAYYARIGKNFKNNFTALFQSRKTLPKNDRLGQSFLKNTLSYCRKEENRTK
jgi:hypothetical protein